MAQDSRNQLQQQRVRIRRWRWSQLFTLLGVPESAMERDDVRVKMAEIEKSSWDIWINKEW